MALVLGQQALVSISDIDKVLNSEVFKSLGNAVLLSTKILSLLLSEAADVVAPYVAYLIMKKGIGSLDVVWLLQNYSSLKAAVEPHGVNPQEILNWFNGWDAHAGKHADKPQIIDAKLSEAIFTAPETQFKVFKEASFKFLDSSDRSEEGWKKIIVDAWPQVAIIARAMADKSVPLASAEPISDAIVATLSDYVHSDESVQLNNQTLAMLNALLQALDEQLRHVVGGRLRALFYSDPKDIGRLFEVLDSFGNLILDIQPANSEEATRLIRLLDYIGRYPDATQRAASFLDGKAEQLSRFRYSERLREGMASVVTKLENRTPRIFKKFARKSWFTSLFKSKTSKEIAEEVGDGIEE
ncbi:hypothetical protein [Pseudomonas sp. JV241A]|uniref:hypothetical protein n=1 Tax=Pseudomonas sp. JV241A TaxID=2078785 RepID=UPI00100C9758|nr:hypothetical protein [Pseudomonas sp. JV241A]SPO67867.1 conserved protein of unknown function [Pseudomonas sp. JV241A]